MLSTPPLQPKRTKQNDRKDENAGPITVRVVDGWQCYLAGLSRKARLILDL